MFILVKGASYIKPSILYIIKRNIFANRAAMSTNSDTIKRDHQEIKEYADNIRMATDDDSKTR